MDHFLKYMKSRNYYFSWIVIRFVSKLILNSKNSLYWQTTKFPTYIWKTKMLTSNYSKMRVRLKSQMFFIITPLIEELLKRTKMFWILDMSPNKFVFLRLCVKLELEDQRGHKVETVMLIEFDLLLLFSLQCAGYSKYITH